jgi:hypothetical protein
MLSLDLNYPRMLPQSSENLFLNLKAFHGGISDTASKPLGFSGIYAFRLLWRDGKLQDGGVINKSDEVICAGSNNEADVSRMP